MLGDEEARARATLTEMQGRLTQGPRSALGLGESPSAEQIRTAFLALTKRYHPARFGRMAHELQRLSNEVFLGIKSAHDTLIRASGITQTSKDRRQTAGMPVVSAEASNQTRVPHHSAPSRPTGTIPAVSRTPTGPQTFRSTTAPSDPSNRRTTPPLGVPIRPTTPAGRPATPSRTPTPPRPDGLDPPTVRGPGVAAQRTAPVFDERAELRAALALLDATSWSAARLALHALAARVPQSKQYRGLLCYARGREAQAAGRPDEAALEFQRALQLDPELAIAKQATAELRRR